MIHNERESILVGHELNHRSIKDDSVFLIFQKCVKFSE